MSLGIKSLWRARNLKVHIGGLSQIPREQYNPPFFQCSSPRQWYSTPIAIRHIPTQDESAKSKSVSALENKQRKFLIRAKFGARPMEPGLIRRPFRYRNKRLTRQSLRQFRRSVARQIISDAIHKASGKPTRNWRAALAFMLMVTPNQGEILHFRVIIGRDVAEKAHEILSAPDTHISDICRKNESFVRMSEISKGELIFDLSGSEVAVRNSLREILGVVETITAVRISDQNLRGLVLDSRKDAKEEQLKTPLLISEEVDDTHIHGTTMTVKRTLSHTHSTYKPYILNQRADDIPVPKKWTKQSFEEYVAALVYGQVPNHRARVLYPRFPDHQHTVVNLLIDAFLNRAARSSISLSATKMAIGFMESAGHGLRPLSHLIYKHIRTLGIHLDAELFTILLVNASKAKNINAFNRLLRVMVRRGYPPQSRAWVAFLVMMPRPSIKRYIVGKLREKNLDQNPMVLRAVGREMATVDLEYQLLRHSTTLPATSSTPSPTPPVDYDIQSFIDEQNDKYGVGWLDTITFNKMLDILSKHELPDACETLLDVVHSARYTIPDAATLNTMLSRTKGFAKQIAMFQKISGHWPQLQPDEGTYHLLFKLAWHRRYPNMVKVLWRYAVHEHKTSSKMRFTLSKLFKQTEDSNSRVKFFKEWVEVIIDPRIIAEMRASYPDGFHARHMFPKYTEPSGMKPAVKIGIMLRKAIAMDMKIHRLLKEGKIAEKQSLSVQIPFTSILQKILKFRKIIQPDTLLRKIIRPSTLHRRRGGRRRGWQRQGKDKVKTKAKTMAKTKTKTKMKTKVKTNMKTKVKTKTKADTLRRVFV
ncbi:hypothetical protein F4806DRAFT_476221 [Annulohypoxylon nitens]|nr:hypothetical protein F4806DRAFT_476221 [Annulohypoxylon nitens]